MISHLARDLITICGSLGVAVSGFAQGDPASVVDFETQIRPLLEAQCLDCHGPDEQQARLRLDQRASVFRGDDQENWRIVPGDPDESELFYRISLPADDFDVMPAEGDPLTAEQIALIRQWILEGAEWPESEAHAPREPERIEIRDLTAAEEEAERAAIARITQRGGLVMPIAQDTRALYVNLSLLSEPFTDDDFALLRGLEPMLAWINLGRSNITDAGAGTLLRYSELRRIHLNGTDVGDASVTQIARLPHLQYLNLYGTSVTDIGVLQLAELKGLRKLFLWQTVVTENSIAKLREANPLLIVDLGNFALAAPETVEATTPVKEMTCCETALEDGKTCVHACCVEALTNSALCEKCNPNPADDLLAKINARAKQLQEETDDR